MGWLRCLPLFYTSAIAIKIKPLTIYPFLNRNAEYWDLEIPLRYFLPNLDNFMAFWPSATVLVPGKAPATSTVSWCLRQRLCQADKGCVSTQPPLLRALQAAEWHHGVLRRDTHPWGLCVWAWWPFSLVSVLTGCAGWPGNPSSGWGVQVNVCVQQGVRVTGRGSNQNLPGLAVRGGLETCRVCWGSASARYCHFLLYCWYWSCRYPSTPLIWYQLRELSSPSHSKSTWWFWAETTSRLFF